MFKNSSFTSSDLKHTCIKLLPVDEVESVTSNSSEMRTKMQDGSKQIPELVRQPALAELSQSTTKNSTWKLFIGSIYFKINYLECHHFLMSGSAFLQKPIKHILVCTQPRYQFKLYTLFMLATALAEVSHACTNKKVIKHLAERHYINNTFPLHSLGRRTSIFWTNKQFSSWT